MKATLYAATLLLAAAAAPEIFAAAPSVGGVAVTDNDGLLTVSYTLAEPAVVTFDATTNGAPIDAACFKSARGDIWALQGAGSHSFTWRPSNDIPLFNLAGADLRVRVKAWDTAAPPDYMVVSLATNATAAVSVAYYECEGQLPGTITDPVYKTSKLVMRKIPAAGVTWRMGSPASERGRGTSGGAETPHLVTLTSDYYLGVYPVTTAQWNYMNGSSGTDMKAAAVSTMSDLRGTSDCALWPGDGHSVTKPGTRLHVIRQYTGIDFDLPTEAQWEFACRAGEAAALYTGDDLSDTTSCDEASDVAWYKANYTGTIGAWQSYMEVGLKAPNAYGLYDMLGNCWEFCLDRYQADLGASAATDPVGSASGTSYVKRGGAVDSDALSCRAAARRAAVGGAWADSVTGNRNTGYRLWAPAQAAK